MNKRKSLQYLFSTSKEMKHSLENPVIFLTQTDFAEDIIHSSIDMRSALLQRAPADRILEIVHAFHIQWLQAVKEIEKFKKRAKDTPRECILKSIDFTKDTAKKRHMHFQKYIDHELPTLADHEKESLQSDLETLEDMQKSFQCTLNEKSKCFLNTADKSEFLVYVFIEADELLNWLDKLYDYLTKEYCKVLDFKVPLFSNLAKTLHQVIDEVASYSTPEAKRVAQELLRKGKTLSSNARITTSKNDVEIAKVVEKIKHLEDRVGRMKIENSSAGVMALQHKAIFLGDRLESLENLKLSLNCLRHHKTNSEYIDDTVKVAENCHDIFNHLIPAQERYRLIERLVQVWQAALGVTDCKSMISILSAFDLKEIFSDDLGHFTVDKHGRKLYRINGDEEIYQLNEKSNLVAVNDDDRHVFFYDDIGRYYLTDNKVRVYRARGGASEYMLHRTGMLLKLSEVVDGIEYRYDNIGCYYIGEDGGHVYRDKDSSDEFRSDGFGNLEKIRDINEYYENCPYSCICHMEPMVVEESKYLQETIGDALKKCLVEIVLVQPEDPIKYLAGMLVKYRCNMEEKQTRLITNDFLVNERERLAEEIRIKEDRSQISFKTNTPPPSLTIIGEQSITDFNFQSYYSRLG